MDALEKKKLVVDLNAGEQKRRETELQKAIAGQAANVFRNRVIVVPNPLAAKTWMESMTPGFVARTVLVDVGMSQKHQKSAKSREMIKHVTAADCKDIVLFDKIRFVVYMLLIKFLGLMESMESMESRKLAR